MKAFLIPVLMMTMAATPVLAATAPLNPGKPAGVTGAQLQDGTGMIILAGATLLGAAIVIATASDGPGAPPASSTSATSP